MVGLGIDAVDIERFTGWSSKNHTQLERVYTRHELQYCLSVPEKAAERFAVRFAAKEALYKALSPLLQETIPLLTLFTLSEVSLDRGIPTLRLQWDKIGLPEQAILLSLTHTKTTALAVVILTPKEEKKSPHCK
jgi:holo-[acyl-carrier protein] synthase